MATILTTTGISIQNNTKRELDLKSTSATEDQMRQFLRLNPKKASSEANSLLQMANQDDHLVLLHTKTPDAIQCNKLLVEYFRNAGYKHVESVTLEFQDDPTHIETTGLRSLVNEIINKIEKAKLANQEIIINATSGFKAQVVYSTMIGMIYQVPVKYIYEGFNKVVTFNPIDVEWDTSLFLMCDKFFQWIDDEARTQEEVNNYLQRYQERERIQEFLTPPDNDGYVFLNYMGHALYSKFRYEKEAAGLTDWPPSANIADNDSKIASSILNRNHHPVKGDLNACRKVAALDCVQGITGGFYEPTMRSAVKTISLDGTIVLLWADDEKASRFTISTTAQGKIQTLKVVQKIKELLEI